MNKELKYIDLSHIFEDDMPGFNVTRPDGTTKKLTAKVQPFLTHKQTKPAFKGKCSFEITEVSFQTSVGTYLDSPFHRHPKMRDISEINLEEVILPGIVIDIRDVKMNQAVEPDIIPEHTVLKGKAVLFNFGWDRYWGQKKYMEYPFVSGKLIEHLIEKNVKLVGVDTFNIDNSKDLSRPAHTLFLKNDILIVENLTNLHKLHGKEFRFFAVPLKVKNAAAFPVRAFAGIIN